MAPGAGASEPATRTARSENAALRAVGNLGG